MPMKNFKTPKTSVKFSIPNKSTFTTVCNEIEADIQNPNATAKATYCSKDSHSGITIIDMPEKTRDKLVTTKALTHLKSETQPTSTLPIVFEIPENKHWPESSGLGNVANGNGGIHKPCVKKVKKKSTWFMGF